MQRSYSIGIKLIKVTVDGRGIGRNWSFIIDIQGTKTSVNSTIDSGSKKMNEPIANQILDIEDNQTLKLPVVISVTEIDPVYNDFGIITGGLDFPATPGTSLSVVSGPITAIGGDEPEKVILTFDFEGLVGLA
ncbi:hypothetical protein ACFLVJ_02100 [Chloroflexota bacterium]